MNIIHYDLFAGIGGFSLALDNIFRKENAKHIFVERDEFCQLVLKKHWPEAEYHSDIKDFITPGQQCLSQLKLFDQTGSWLKMLRDLLLCNKEWFSNKCALTWKVKVTKYNRLLYQLSPSTRRIEGTESGLLPTARANDARKTGNIANDPRNGLPAKILYSTLLLATPNTMDAMEPKTPKAVIKEMTVTRKGRTNFANLKEQVAYGQKLQTGTTTGLKLQPAFVEFLMGFPEGWTEIPDSKVLEMRSSRKLRRKSLK